MKRNKRSEEELRNLSSLCDRAADSSRRITLSPMMTVIVFVLLYRTTRFICDSLRTSRVLQIAFTAMERLVKFTAL